VPEESLALCRRWNSPNRHSATRMSSQRRCRARRPRAVPTPRPG
jgi:hypothetical protein